MMLSGLAFIAFAATQNRDVVQMMSAVASGRSIMDMFIISFLELLTRVTPGKLDVLCSTISNSLMLKYNV